MSWSIERLTVSTGETDFPMARLAFEEPDGTLHFPSTYRIIRGEIPVIVLEREGNQ